MVDNLPSGPSFVFSETGHDHVWAELAAKDPSETARNAGAVLVGQDAYLVDLIGEKYLFEPGVRRVTGPADRPAPDKRVVLSLLHYLVGARATGLANRLVPETVLPGGQQFFTGGHALPRTAIVDAFGQDGAAFLERAAKLGAEIIGSEVPDSFSFSIFLLPKIFVQVTLSQADEEFPAALNFAFDPSGADHVPLGVLASLIGLLNTFLLAAN